MPESRNAEKRAWWLRQAGILPNGSLMPYAASAPTANSEIALQCCRTKFVARTLASPKSSIKARHIELSGSPYHAPGDARYFATLPARMTKAASDRADFRAESLNIAATRSGPIRSATTRPPTHRYPRSKQATAAPAAKNRFNADTQISRGGAEVSTVTEISPHATLPYQSLIECEARACRSNGPRRQSV